MVFVHGESFEWGGGHVYDVSVWASQSHVIAVTLNYRLGPLGKCHTVTDSLVLSLTSQNILHNLRSYLLIQHFFLGSLENTQTV